METNELIGWALGGIEREIAETRERLAVLTAQAAELRGRAGGKVAAAASANDSGVRAGRRQMSAAGRKRISEMMKKRWAEAKRKKQNRLT